MEVSDSKAGTDAQKQIRQAKERPDVRHPLRSLAFCPSRRAMRDEVPDSQTQLQSVRPETSDDDVDRNNRYDIPVESYASELAGKCSEGTAR